MPHRLFPDNSNWGGDLGLPPASYVSPNDWTVDLFLTNNGKKDCPSGVTFDWTVTLAGKTTTLDSHGCSVQAKVPMLGVYSVTAKELKGGAPGKGERCFAVTGPALVAGSISASAR